jgi:cytidine deaminase
MGDVGLDVGERLLRAAELARRLAQPPVSGFHVGAAALGLSGRAYVGLNVELPGQPLQQTIHAEHFSIGAAVACGEAGLAAVAVTASPCGHCRQMLAELEGAETLVVFMRGADGRVLRLRLLGDLLPHAVSASLLGSTLADFRRDTARTRLEARPDAALPRGCAAPLQEGMRALRIAQVAYSRARAACAIVTHDGQTYCGAAIESVAFNPGVPPMQSAIIQFARVRLYLAHEHLAALELRLAALDGEAGYDLFEDLAKHAKYVLLLECAGSVIRHKRTVLGIVEDVLPGAILHCVQVDVMSDQ